MAMARTMARTMTTMAVGMQTGTKAVRAMTTTMSIQTRTLATSTHVQRAATATTAGKDLPSYARALFEGRVSAAAVFPYPDVITTDARESLTMMVESTSKFFETVNDAAKNDETSTVPEPVAQGMRDLGLFGLQVPEELDGAGLSNSAYARMVEIVGGHDLGVGIYLGAHQSIGFKGIMLFGTDAQKKKYLPSLATGAQLAAFALTEPSSGSDANSIRTRAKRSADGKHFILNGGKIWISNGGLAHVFTVFAQTEVVDPKTNQKVDKVTAFIVERAFGGVSSGPPEKKMGIRASNTAVVNFDDTPIPVENVLGEVGGGFKVAMAILNNGRFGMGAALTGTMKRLIALAAEHANTRKQFGSLIRDYGLIREKFAQMAIKAYVAESVAYLVSGTMDRGAQDYQIEAAISKVFASEAAWFVCDEAIQVMGGLGFMREYPFERFMRDARIFRIFEGANEILRLFIALEGIKSAGAGLKQLQAAAKNPLANPGVLVQALTKRIKSTVGIAPTPSGDSLSGHVHPELASCAQLIAAQTAQFGDAVEAILIKHGKNVVNEQLVLKRLADSAIDLFGMAATTSRASRSLGAKLPSAAHEVLLTKAFCEDANRRITNNLRDARAPGRTTDAKLLQIAGDVFTKGGFVPTHPLGV